MYYILLDSLAKRDCGEYFSAVCNGQCSIFKRGRNCKNVFVACRMGRWTFFRHRLTQVAVNVEVSYTA